MRTIRFLTLAVLLLYAFLPAAAVAAKPKLALDGDVKAGKLRIGGNLVVEVKDGEPGRRYTLLLVDEANQTVTSAVQVVTDVAGNGRRRLWTRTGVVGCDLGAVHDPAKYQFRSFAEAESALGGRTFQVFLLDNAASSLAKAYARIDVPMEVVTPPVRAYPSDKEGCLRTELRLDEPVYLAIRHRSPADEDFRIFVVSPQAVWNAGDPLNDVRGVVQTISVPPAALSVELLWASPVKGEYQIIVREGFGTGPGFNETTDFAVEIHFSPGGTTDPECDPCPPPPPQVGGP